VRSPPRPSPRAARLLLALVALAALVATGLAAYRLLTQESTTPASPQGALARFRAAPRRARTLPPALRGRAPLPGVYVYATRGFEESRVLGVRRHVYPARTTITILAAGCGIASRWDALATRWDAFQACPRGAGWALASTSESHEFVGHLDRRTYRCTARSTARPAAPRPGASWSTRCALPGTTTAEQTTVLGAATLTVAGRQVRTALLRTRTRVSGDTSGTGLALTWIVPRTGLVVRRVVANASTTKTVVGGVAYTERYTLALSSPRPLR